MSWRSSSRGWGSWSEPASGHGFRTYVGGRPYGRTMPYSRSEPLKRWLVPRRETIDALAKGHAAVGALTGPGRPLDASKPLAHAYVIVVVGQFQGFIRDLHDLAVERLVSASGATTVYAPLLTDAIARGRAIDRGNATLRNVKDDFGRIGIRPFNLASYNLRWTSPGDAEEFDRLLALRNVLGHSNERGLAHLLADGQVLDTVSWARSRIPVLNRFGKALDRMVWDHLKASTGKGPW